MARRTIRQAVAHAAFPATVVAAVAVGVAMSAAAKPSVTMRGSPASMERQYAVAVSEDYTFAENPSAVDDLVKKERLVRLPGGADYALAKVSYPYARPEVKTFVENLSADYRKACGEQLVVTSLTRPRAEQPGNAHKLSVHPAGMAVDFRISRNSKCRKWFENALLGLEDKDLLDATRERNPPHYHVAVYPDAYRAYAARTTPKVAPPTDRSPTVLRPRPAPSTRAEEPAAAAEQQRSAPGEPAGAEPPIVLMLLSSVALLFILGWRMAKQHGPG